MNYAVLSDIVNSIGASSPRYIFFKTRSNSRLIFPSASRILFDVKLDRSHPSVCLEIRSRDTRQKSGYLREGGGGGKKGGVYVTERFAYYYYYYYVSLQLYVT